MTLTAVAAAPPSPAPAVPGTDGLARAATRTGPSGLSGPSGRPVPSRSLSPSPSAPSTPSTPSTAGSNRAPTGRAESPEPAPIDLDRLTDAVQQRLVRRLDLEARRRGVPR